MIRTEGAEACPPGPDARLAAIRRLLLDETLAPSDRIAGCLVALYGQQPSRIAALRTTDTSCAAGATRLKLGADWLDVPEPVATLLRQHLRNRTNMTTAANPASPWLFPGQLTGEHRSYRRLVRVLHQLGIPARASRLAAWRELVRNAPPAVLASGRSGPRNRRVRVTRALTQLEAAGLVETGRERQRDRFESFHLNREDGSQRQYTIPGADAPDTVHLRDREKPWEVRQRRPFAELSR